MIEKKSPALIDKEVYILPTKTKINIAIVSITFFTISLIFHFPLREFIKVKIVDALAMQKACPIIYENIEVSFLFLPSVNIVGPTIDSRCLPKGMGPIKLDSLEVTLVGPSFIPPGLRIRTDLNYSTKESISAYWSQSFTKGILKIPKTVLDGAKLASLSNNQKIFEGQIELEGLAEVASGKLINMDFLGKSSNLKILPLTIAGFNLPSFKLDTLFLKISSKKPGQITIEDGVLGHEDGPISAKITGDIDLNLVNFPASKPTLKGNVKFSDTFLEQFAIIKLLLSSKVPQNGYYSFEYQGTFARPLFKFL